MHVCVSVSVWSTAAVADIVVFRDTHHPPSPSPFRYSRSRLCLMKTPFAGRTSHHLIITVTFEAFLKPVISGSSPLPTPLRGHYHTYLAFCNDVWNPNCQLRRRPPPMRDTTLDHTVNTPTPVP
ncbi:hypothetical protein BKA70DRAFT_1252845 [Coprinopsis sp. MPI-PUGE-AT-0042]|nr:hypothetical protein BKA70DRAFT_1252845 [Coprinopsis sp. MPI-PUGE-AT-0042]